MPIASAAARLIIGYAVKNYAVPVVKGFAKSAIHGFEENPKKIIIDARNPNVDAEEVLVRARLRSHTGRLLAKVEELIAQRPSQGLFE